MLIQRQFIPLRNWTRGRLPTKTREMIDTEDIVQETLISTIKQLPNFEVRHPGAFRAYLRRAVINRIRSEIRKLANRPTRSAEVENLSCQSPSPLETMVGKDTLNRYEAAMEMLSEANRELIIARVEMRLTYAEIARDQGKSSPDAARMAVSRALLKLAEGMGNE